MQDDLSHRTDRKLSPGWHYPLGATLGVRGVNFSLHSATAEEVWLLLFDRPDGDPTDIIRVQDRDRFAWRGDASPSIPFERMVIHETRLMGV